MEKIIVFFTALIRTSRTYSKKEKKKSKWGTLIEMDYVYKRAQSMGMKNRKRVALKSQQAVELKVSNEDNFLALFSCSDLVSLAD